MAPKKTRLTNPGKPRQSDPNRRGLTVLQVHYMWPNGKGQMLVSTQKEPPSYERLLSLLRKVPGSKSARSWVERVLRPDWITGDGGLDLPPADLSPGQPAPSTQAGTPLC